MRIHDLPYKQVWALDFEFCGPEGGRKTVMCMVAKELRSGRELRFWRDQLPAQPPFDIGPDSLFIAYAANAEMACFAELGWPMPARVLDPYVEFKHATNGFGRRPYRLLDALSHYGLPQFITSEQKTAMRDLILSGGPWSAAQRRAILDYCATDVVPLEPLLERMLPDIWRTDQSLGQALLRGRFMNALAHIDITGVPIDVETHELLMEHREGLKASMIAEINPQYGVYVDGSFNYGRFEDYLEREGILWPRTEKGQLKTDSETFDDMALVYPQAEALGGLRYVVDKLKPAALEIGPDGRSRAWLDPFGTITGRNNGISGNKHIFGLSAWVRSLIKPERGRTLAYIDYSSQEVVIAATLSGDRNMLHAVESGDPYLTFAKLAKMVPPDATKESHKTIRDQCKRCVLGTNYGMGVDSLAIHMGVSREEARRSQAAMRTTFPTYTEWSMDQINIGQLTGRLTTQLGWVLNVTDDTKPNTLRNFKMQANGSEILRLACCLATERGINVCAPVHDALLVEGDDSDMSDVIAAARKAMAEASDDVLDYEIDTSVEKVISYPHRYIDGRGDDTWQQVKTYLDRVRGGGVHRAA